MKLARLVPVLFLVVVRLQTAEAKPPPSPASGTPASATANDDRVRAIIDKVREAEDRYRNLETVVRINSEYKVNPDDPRDPLNVETEEVRYSLTQGDLFRFKRRLMKTFGSGEQSLSEQAVAYDGETTQSVVFGNCVNLIAGRREPWDFSPPHALGMYALPLNFPLSVYLQGSEAIRKHPKVAEWKFRDQVLGRIEVAFDGNETVDGLSCVKLVSRRWFKGGGKPMTEQIFLAPERNYHCVKYSATSGEDEQAGPVNEARTTSWLELGPGLWLPKTISLRKLVIHYGTEGKPAVVWRRDTLFVEQAIANGENAAGRFSGIELPERLPVYRIDRGGYLEGSGVRSATTKPSDASALDRIIAELRQHEQRVERFDVSVASQYRTLHAGFVREIVADYEVERTISDRGRLYKDRRQTSQVKGMGDNLSSETAGWDGQWIRSLFRNANKGDLPVNPDWASLRKGGPKGLDSFRPHTALFDDWRMRSRPLSDFLTAEFWDETNRYRYLVECLGEEIVDGLPCEKLRLGFMQGDQTQPDREFFFLWLAKDRNYVPVRAEHVDLKRSARLPTGVMSVDDLREAAPGIWIPFHTVSVAFEKDGSDGLGGGQVLLRWRRDRRIEAVDLEPNPADELFAPAAPAGTLVTVCDEAGASIGQFRQKEDGVPRVSDDKYRTMAEAARVNEEEQRLRTAAMDALIGSPFPEMPEATWLNGSPLSNASLEGKVLLIDFWAEWCGPCRTDLETLGKLDGDLVADGVTLIGVHAAGSERAEVEKVVSELDLDYPIYIDAAGRDGKVGWGKLYEKFAVRELPHAFVVDRRGKIAAHGRLDQMLPRARALAAKK